MRSPVAPCVPAARPIEKALDESAALSRLRGRIDDSNRRFETIGPLLPAALRHQVHPGPIDETGWTLLADNASVAAKLRQLQPRIENVLHEQGWEKAATRVRIRPPR